MRICGLASLGWLVAVVVLGCSGKKHAPFIAPPPTNQANGGPGNGNDPSNEEPDENPDAGEPSDMDGGEPTDMPSDDAGSSPMEPGTGTLDSAQVYWTGKAADTEYSYAISTVAAPERYSLGIIPYVGDTFAFGNHAIFYQHEHGPVLKFDADSDGPPSPTPLEPDTFAKNDKIVPTKACTASATAEGPRAFLVSPRGRMIYQCINDNWYDGEKLVYDPELATLLALGDTNLAFGRNGYTMYLVNLAKGSEVAIENVGEYLLGVRAVADGFDIVTTTNQDSRGEASLDHVDAKGGSRNIGKYPALPGSYTYWLSAVAADYSVYQFARRLGDDMFIVRRPLGAESEFVYTQTKFPQGVGYQTPVRIVEPITNMPRSALFAGQ